MPTTASEQYADVLAASKKTYSSPSPLARRQTISECDFTVSMFNKMKAGIVNILITINTIWVDFHYDMNREGGDVIMAEIK